MNVTELLKQHPDIFQREYEKWSLELLGPWWEPIYEQAIEDGKELGFEIMGINFSGFASQGDGASWHGQIRLLPCVKASFDLTDPSYNILAALLEEGYVAGTLQIRNHSSRYYHSNCMTSVEGLWFYRAEDTVMKTGVYQGAKVEELMEAMGGFQFLDNLDARLVGLARTYADAIYKQLEEEYNYLTSVDCYVEYCKDNEVDFEVPETEVQSV